jgi:2-polyprenyl-3-methyl-5-hydroxy-6-metoxy-1,4-benzoquinol methylase
MSGGEGGGPLWREVWGRRALDPARGSTLAQLMAADGLDTGFGSVGEDAWRAYVRGVAERLGIAPPASVFEVGCGAGAFLHELAQAGCPVGGLDFSPALIGFARAALPGGRFETGEAAHLDPAGPWDFVVSSGVFSYFPSLAYAEDVLRRMVRKARRGVAVLDVSDAARKADALRIRKGYLSDAEYEERYRGLDHLYYDRAWLARALAAAGARDVVLEDQRIEGYANSAYRFNAFARIG